MFVTKGSIWNCSLQVGVVLWTSHKQLSKDYCNPEIFFYCSVCFFPSSVLKLEVGGNFFVDKYVFFQRLDITKIVLKVYYFVNDSTNTTIRSGPSGSHSFCSPDMIFRNRPKLKVCHLFEDEAEFAPEGVNSYRNVDSCVCLAWNMDAVEPMHRIQSPLKSVETKCTLTAFRWDPKMEAQPYVSGCPDPIPASELIFEYAVTPVPVPAAVSLWDIQMPSPTTFHQMYTVYIYPYVFQGDNTCRQ